MPAASSPASSKKPQKKRLFFKKTGSKKKTLNQPKKRTAKLVQPEKPVAGNQSLPQAQPKPQPITTSPESTPKSTPEPEPNKPSQDLDTAVADVSPTTDKKETDQSDATETEKQAINHSIETAAKNLSSQTKAFVSEKEAQDDSAAPAEDYVNIDGLNQDEEQLDLLSREIRSYQKKTVKLKHELDVIKTDFDKEKNQLKKTIRDLRKELHRTAPLHDHKFFSLSQELRDAIKEIDSNLDHPVDLDSLPPTSSGPTSSTAPSSSPLLSAPTTSSQPDTPVPQPSKPKQFVPKKGKDKKLLITGVILLFLLVSGAAVSYKIVQQPQVNKDLVNEYLDGQVQGATTTNTRQPKVDRYAEVPFDQTTWEGFEDPFLGFKFNYPANVAEKQKNGNGIALLRKDGYLFKIQNIAYEKTLQDYWEETKDIGLKYEVEKSTLHSQPALHLILQEETDYPGNRYLIKINDAVIDVWYATESDKFSADDIKRSQQIVDSIRFF